MESNIANNNTQEKNTESKTTLDKKTDSIPQQTLESTMQKFNYDEKRQKTY